MRNAHSNDEKAAPVLDHFSELRRRIIKIAVIWIAGAALAAIYSKEMFQFLARPLLASLAGAGSFIALSPIEGWVVYFKISFVASLFFTAPLWFYQIWAFVTPALKGSERRIVFWVSIASALCFAAGGFFGFFIVLPKGFYYLAAIYKDIDVTLYPQMEWYLSFVLRVLVAFGIVFETPLLLVCLSRLGLVTTSAMRSARKYVIVGIFIFAAIITPGPDVFSQIAVAIPLIIFYEVGIIVANITRRDPSPPPSPTGGEGV